MKYFILIMCIMTIAFVQVYLILKTEIVEEDEPFELLWVLYNAAWLGDYEEGFDGAVIDRLMFGSMTVFMVVVLLNLLIAIMADTFATVQESATVEFYHTFAELVYELELLMTAHEHRSLKLFPQYMIYSESTANLRAAEEEGPSEEDSEGAKKAAKVEGNQGSKGMPEVWCHQVLGELKALRSSSSAQQQVLGKIRNIQNEIGSVAAPRVNMDLIVSDDPKSPTVTSTRLESLIPAQKSTQGPRSWNKEEEPIPCWQCETVDKTEASPEEVNAEVSYAIAMSELPESEMRASL
eukprot:gnl/TRDRNA2_/TRDRNA2_142065_c1_seq1.p1 gnl/TRDRNA2_/TRDRNA2_142065_c1~~gnl/TRDRNA2_/TRDRNA2_142065_c1_seq1.p1  ORF type:complete len:294 (+),score=70.36 gnl/TRDRNA2_/TRDRNA2_142065_c1_seq1:1-882(+)